MKLTNTLSGQKEDFLAKHKTVKLYGCGVTPYDYAHIGHGRSYVFIDLLVRFLKYRGFDVTYVRNVTDIDDKLLKKAEKAGDIRRYIDIAQEFTQLYQQEMGELNCLIPDHEPKVTDHIDEIIAFIEKLVEKGCAYVVDHDVYFDITVCKDYGTLSGKNLDDLQAGARVKVDERKKHPADFVLWKGNDAEQFWKSPWGYGRPGWHIECSVLSSIYLGETVDIHCGGADLIFPHHENERAQSEALYEKTFVRYWVHNALLNIDKKKMSKSLGNILSLKEIFIKHDPMVLRYYFLQHHYRTPIEFSFEMLDAAEVAYKKLIKLFADVDSVQDSQGDLSQEIIAALDDDLNSPKALGLIFEHAGQIRENKSLAGEIKHLLTEVFGLTLESIEAEVFVTPEMADLIEKRNVARAEKDWEEADKIREQLKALGYDVQDKKL